MTEADPGLEQVLRTREPEIADAGFSESVLRQLPARRSRRGRARRWTLAGAAGLGSLLTLLLAEPVEPMLRSVTVLPAPMITTVALVLIVSIPLAWILYSE
jgi:hypothetical protein